MVEVETAYEDEYEGKEVQKRITTATRFIGVSLCVTAQVSLMHK